MSDATPSPASGQPPSPRRKGRGVLCGKCEHLNPSELENCEYCDEPLHMTCTTCGQVNARVLTQCTKCRSPLHRAAGAPAREDSGKGDKTRRPAQVTAPGKGILCTACDHLNPDGLEQCEHCNADLFVECPNCQSRNNRAHERCRKCRTSLGSTTLKDRLLGKRSEPSIRPVTEEAIQKAGDGKTIACAKCGHLNPPRIDRCEACMGHLYIVCRKCKNTNPRVLQRCVHCDHRLHRTSSEGRKSGGSPSRPLNLVFAGVALLSFIVAAVLLIKMSGLRLLK